LVGELGCGFFWVNSYSHLLERRKVRRVETRRRRTASARSSRRVERARLVVVTWLVNCCQRWKNTKRYTLTAKS